MDSTANLCLILKIQVDGGKHISSPLLNIFVRYGRLLSDINSIYKRNVNKEITNLGIRSICELKLLQMTSLYLMYDITRITKYTRFVKDEYEEKPQDISFLIKLVTADNGHIWNTVEL